MDPNRDNNILSEQLRAQMLGSLRRAHAALVITMDKDGRISTSYFNLTTVERRGLIEILQDTAPHFYPVSEEDDDDGDAS